MYQKKLSFPKKIEIEFSTATFPDKFKPFVKQLNPYQLTKDNGTADDNPNYKHKFRRFLKFPFKVYETERMRYAALFSSTKAHHLQFKI